MNKKNVFSIIGSVYGIKELSEMLGVSTRTIYEYAKSGILKGRKIGRSWLFTEKNVLNFLNCEEMKGDIKNNGNSRL